MVEIARGAFLKAVAASASSAIFPNTKMLTKRSMRISFPDVQQFDGRPSLTEVAASSTVAWAAARFASRVFRVTPDFEIKTFDFRDEGWAVNLVPFDDGSVYFRQGLLEGGPAEQIRDILRLSPTGTVMSKIRSPKDKRVTQIQRLGADALIAGTDNSGDLLIADGDGFSALRPSGRPIERSIPICGLRRAADGAVWYLRGSFLEPAQIVGRIDSNFDFAERTIDRNGRRYSIGGLTPFGETSMLLFLGDGIGRPGSVCLMDGASRRLDMTFFGNTDKALCAGNFDREQNFWFVDPNAALLYVGSGLPPKVKRSIPLGTTSLTGCDASLFASFRRGVLLPGFSSIDYYSLS